MFFWIYCNKTLKHIIFRVGNLTHNLTHHSHQPRKLQTTPDFFVLPRLEIPHEILGDKFSKKNNKRRKIFFLCENNSRFILLRNLKGRQISSFKKSTKNDEKMSTCVNFDCLQLQSNFTSWHFFIVLCAIFKTTYLSTLQIPKWNKSWVVFTKKILHASWNPYW